MTSMGIIEGSVAITTGSSGNYSLEMPENNLDIIGIGPYSTSSSYGAPEIVGIFLDASNVAYFPLPYSTNTTSRKYSPVHIKLKGNTLNITIPNGLSGGGIIAYYGTPTGDEIEIASLKGVPFLIQNSSTTAVSSGTQSISFPSGNIKLVGLYASANVNGQLSFNTGTGRTLTVAVSTLPDPMDLPDNIYALNLSSATQLAINYQIGYNSAGSALIWGIMYYQ